MFSNGVIVLLLVVAVGLGTYVYRGLVRRRWRRLVCCALPMLVCLAFGLNALPGVPLVGSWLQHGAYRTEQCERDAALIAVRTTTREDGGEASSGKPPCAVEFVVNDTGQSRVPDEGIPAGDCWTAADAAQTTARNCYSIASLEFSDTGDLSSPEQLSQLQHHLARLSSALTAKWQREWALKPDDAARSADLPGVYLIAYVHGWRNDARPTNGDFRHLRVMISAAARDLAARCRIVHRYCNTAAVGLFLGWRGAVGLWDAGADEQNHNVVRAGQVLNGLTFQGRKTVSDGLGIKVLAQLSTVREMMKTSFPQPDPAAQATTHMLLIGHSLGGNLVLSGVPIAAPRNDRLGLPSDLAVIINPATETRKWVDLWRKVQAPRAAAWSAITPPRLVFLMSPPNYFGRDIERSERSWAALWPSWFDRWTPHKVVAAEQKARQADLTDAQLAANKLASDREAAALRDYDTVVDGAFWWSQVFARWPFGEACAYALEVNGLGHMPIDGGPCKDKLSGIYSHFVEVNYSANTDVSPASYINAADPARSCFVEPGFLACARSRRQKFELRCGDLAASAPTS